MWALEGGTRQLRPDDFHALHARQSAPPPLPCAATPAPASDTTAARTVEPDLSTQLKRLDSRCYAATYSALGWIQRRSAPSFRQGDNESSY